MSDLKAVIFDVDGTIADSERYGHRVAFNLAFERLGMPDRWDEERYGELLLVPGGKARLRHYLSGKGVPPEERSRLADELHPIKNECFIRLVREGQVPLRCGIARLLDELAAEEVRVAVATTGSRGWVVELLELLLGPRRRGRFEVLATGEDVARTKPDPQIYRVALARLGLEAAQAVAVEDSETGLRSAKGAGLACLAVRNPYSAGGDFQLADLVVDDLGEPGMPAPVVLDPHRLAPGDCVGVGTLRAILASSARTRSVGGEATSSQARAPDR